MADKSPDEQSQWNSDLSELLFSLENKGVEELKSEIERLHTALVQTSSEKHEAGELGLRLLEQRDHALEQYNALNVEYEQLRSEFQDVQQSLNHRISADRLSAQLQAHDEDQLAAEKSDKETRLAEAVNQLEHELRLARSHIQQLQNDNERLSVREKDLDNSVLELEQERLELREEAKTAKARERKAADELLQLEEENVALQKQVSQLKVNQIENDSLKAKLNQLEEKCIEISRELEDEIQQKENYRVYYEKTVEALNAEKEMKNSYKNELEAAKSAETFHTMMSFHQERLDTSGFEDGDTLNGSIDDLAQFVRAESNRSLANGSHNGDVESTDYRADEDWKKLATHYQKELENYQAKCISLQEEIESFKAQNGTEKSSNEFQSQQSELLQAQQALSQSKEKAREAERKLATFESDNRHLISSGFCSLEEMISVANELASLFEILSSVSDPTPTSKVFTERLKDVEKQVSTKDRSSFDPELQMEVISLLQEQIRQLRRCCENATKQRVSPSTQGSEDTSAVDDAAIAKLKDELNKKREQNASLRAVLKANKQTAEVAINNLKMRYEQDKQIVHETTNKLKSELKALKEDAATFAYIRSMLVSRCESYATQFEESRAQTKALQEEKKTLESLLRMAIHQKIALTERIETVEKQASKSRPKTSKSHQMKASDAAYMKNAFVQKSS